MSSPAQRQPSSRDVASGGSTRRWSALIWTARVTSLAMALLLAAAFTDGPPPVGREWAYVALFPMGFCLASLLSWKWPRVGGYASLACMGLSLLVVGRIFDTEAYFTWALLCLPSLLFVIAGGVRARA